MVKYILKRLGLAILILFGVSLIIYFLVRLMPYDFVESQMASLMTSGSNGGTEVTEELIATMKARYGLGDDSFWGILSGYGKWLWSLMHLDLGDSWAKQIPVVELIANNMGKSFYIAFIGIIFEYLIAIPLGVTAATHQYSVRDYVVTVLVIMGISLPSFFLGYMFQYIFHYQLGWFPLAGLENAAAGYTGFAAFMDQLYHLVLPISVLVLLGIGGTMRYMRTNMLEVLNSDYIRTARAKGLPESKVIYKHAFRNTMIPIVTMMAGILPTLFSGAMITEEVFAIDGIGSIALDTMNKGDIPVIMGYNMFIAVLSVIGVLLSDLMYAVVDPRVKLY